MAAKRKLTKRGKQRREELVAIASQLFSEKGYHLTSVSDVVEAAGVGKGVFYWYFSSKEALFLEVLRGTQTTLRRRQEKAISDEPDPVKCIESGIRVSLHWLHENRQLFNLFQFAMSEERFAPYLRLGQSVIVADILPHVKEAIVQGRVREQDPELAAQAILGVTAHLAHVYLVRNQESVEEIADAAVSFCLNGVLGDDKR